MITGLGLQISTGAFYLKGFIVKDLLMMDILLVKILSVIAIGLIGLLILLALLAILFLFMIYPGRQEKKRYAGLLDYDYAHRGFHNEADAVYENTLEAFKLAVDHGYGAELDVRLTKDKRVVVFHDDDTSRLCGVDKAVKDLTYDELRAMKIKDSQSFVPNLEEVVELFSSKTPLIVELKVAGKDMEICQKVQDIMEGSGVDYCIESFNPEVVRWYKKNRPEVVRGQLSVDYMKAKTKAPFLIKMTMTHLLFGFALKPDFVAYNHWDVGALGFRIYRKLFKKFTVGWTIVSQEQFQEARKNFDLIIFEGFHPDRSD